MATSFRRKQNRLPLNVYRGVAAFSVTVRAVGRPFSNAFWTTTCADLLRTIAERHHYAVFAYCFMPDHLHLLLAGNHPGAFLPDFMRDFKRATRYAYMKRFRRVLWQKSYYDHACRRGEDLTAAARYIVGNPVRSGLVENAADYPFNGSFVLARGALMEG